MRFLVTAMTACVWAGSALAEEPAEMDAWPFPEDIPQASPADPGLAGAQPPNIVRFLKIRGITGARLSSDGGTLAFRTATTGQPQLWTVSARGGWPRQLTFGGSVSSHMWHPDGMNVLYGADREGDERLGLTLISEDGRTESIVRPYSQAFIVPGGFSTDGKRFAYSTTQRNGTDFDIHVLDLETDTDRKVIEGSFGFFVAAWRPGHPEVIVSETRGEDANNLYRLNVDTGELRTLFKPEDASAYESIEWRPDGSGFYLVTDQDREFKALASYTLETGELEILSAPEGQDVERVELVDGRYLLWVTNVGGYSRLYAKDLDADADLAAPAGLPVGVYSLDGASSAPKVAITVDGPTVPGDVYTWDLQTAELVHAARSTIAGIDPVPLVVPESLTFEASDGVELHGLLYMPREIPDGKKPPVVVRVHGGPTAQARPSFRAVEQYLVARGIAVFDLNFRGSTGFGKSFARLDNQYKRRDAVRDVAETIDWLGASERVDASRAAVMGGSYGGYLVNAVVGEYPDKYVAGVSFVGVSDWVRALETASPGLKASDRIEYGDISDPEVRAFHEELSPIKTVDRIKAAMMVLHGANDPRDPVAESDAFVMAIRENGGEVEYLRFPDEGHGIRKLTNRITAYRRVAGFLRKHLQGAE